LKDDGVGRILEQLPALLLQACANKPENLVVRNKKRRKSSFLEPGFKLFREAPLEKIKEKTQTSQKDLDKVQSLIHSRLV
jgi:hypothetical protein